MRESKSQKTLNMLPYGIISGACAMFVFFATFGLIAAYLIQSGIAGQTNDTVSFFENAWQVVLFVFDIVFLIGTIGGLVMYILKKLRFFNAAAIVTKEESK